VSLHENIIRNVSLDQEDMIKFRKLFLHLDPDTEIFLKDASASALPNRAFFLTLAHIF